MTVEEAKRKMENDVLLFGKICSPNTFRVKSPKFHYELADIYHNTQYDRVNVIAPRGHGKTSLSKFFMLHHLMYGPTKIKVIVIVSKTQGHSKKLLTDLKDVMEYSKSFREIFGYWGKESARRWSEEEVELKDGSLIIAKGSTMQLVGINHLSQRPTLYIYDDPEDENNTATKEAMEKTMKILLKGVDPGADPIHGRIFVIGTPQREGCLVERLKEMPNWLTKHYDAIVDEEKKKVLWPEWVSWDMLMERKASYESINRLSIFFSEYRCFRKNTPVITSGGKHKQICNIKPGEKLLSDYGETKVIESKAVGIQHLVDIELETGDKFQATLDHKWKVNGKKIKTIDLEEIEIAPKPRYARSKEAALARLVGYNLGDGHAKTFINSQGYPSAKVEFYAKYQEDIERISQDIKIVYGKEYAIQYREIKGNPLYYIVVTGSAARNLIAYGCIEGKKIEQNFRVPKWIRKGNKGLRREFLAALYGAEGNKPAHRKNSKALSNLKLEMVKSNPEHLSFFLDILDILKDFNLDTHLTIRKNKNNNYTILWLLSKKEDQRRFFKHIGYRYCGYKERLAFGYEYYLKIKTSLSYSEWVRWNEDKLLLKVTSKTILPPEEVWNITVDTPDNSYYVGNIYANTQNCKIIGDEDQLFTPGDFRYWDGEYQQDFRGESFIKLTAVGKKVRDGLDWIVEWQTYEEPKVIPINTFMGVDPASSISKTADFSVVMPIGVDAEKHIYVLPPFRKRVKPMELARTIIGFYSRYKPKITNIETTGYQEMLRDYLRNESGVYIPGLERKNQPRNSKNRRIETLQPFFFNKQVYFKKGMSMLEEFESELLLYPRTSHDDFLDALYYAKKSIYSPRHEHEDEKTYNKKKRATRRPWTVC